jgi:hypothetical protein
MKKSRASTKQPPMKGFYRQHLEIWFQQYGTDRDVSEPRAPLGETKANRNARGKRYSAEGLITLMWQAVLRPDDALGTENKPNEPQCSYLVFFNRNSLPAPYTTPYAHLAHMEYHPHGRKNDRRRKPTYCSWSGQRQKRQVLCMLAHASFAQFHAARCAQTRFHLAIP